jgi:hypothetical protein
MTAPLQPSEPFQQVLRLDPGPDGNIVTNGPPLALTPEAAAILARIVRQHIERQGLHERPDTDPPS